MKHFMKIAMAVLLLSKTVAAQSEKLQLTLGQFYVPQAKEEHFMPKLKNLDVRQIGASYTHRFDKNWALRGAYTQWFRFLNLQSGFEKTGNGYYNKLDFPYAIGDVLNRYDYKMIDLSAIYRKPIALRHEIYAAAGVSYAWGRYIEITKRHNEPGYPDWIFESETKKAQHLGLMAELGYNYLLKNRINIGVSEAIRAYHALPIQLYFNINFGYSFNWASSTIK